MKNGRGFTLVELLVTIMVTVLVIGAAVTLFIKGWCATQTAIHKTSALHQAQAKIEEDLVLRYSQVVSGTTVDNVSLDTSLTGTRTTVISDITNGKKILVTVDWVDYGRSMQEFVETVIYSPD